MRAFIIASVRGSLNLNLVPFIGIDSTSIEPFIFSMADLTASMPTPLPDVSLMVSDVLNPERKIRFTASLSESFSASS